MSGTFLRKYGVAITAGAQSIKIPIIKRSSVDFAVSADWTPAAGDVKISKDGGAAANIATLPTAVAMGNTAFWEFVFSAAELQAKTIVVTVADSATKAVEDQLLIIETYGDASAFYQADLSAANLPANVVQFGGSNGTFSGGIPDVNVASMAAGAVASIWNALTSGMTTVGSIAKRIIDNLTGDAYARIGANGAGLTAIGDTRLANLDAAVSSRAVAGDAMTLTSGERTAVANEVESQIIDETDSEKVLTAITDKIASVNPSLGDLTLAAIASQVRTELATELARIDVNLSSLATASALSTVGTNVSTVSTNLNTLKGDWDNGGRLDLLLDSTLADTNELQTRWADTGTLAITLGNTYQKATDANSAANQVLLTTTKFDGMLEDDSGVSRFTANALEQAPTGGGGGGGAPTTAEITAAILAMEVNTGESFQQWTRRVRAMLYGKVSGGGTGTEVFKAADGTTAAVTVTADRKGNRTGVTLG